MFQLFCVVRKELDLHTSDTLSHNMITESEGKERSMCRARKPAPSKKLGQNVHAECMCASMYRHMGRVHANKIYNCSAIPELLKGLGLKFSSR